MGAQFKDVGKYLNLWSEIFGIFSLPINNSQQNI